MTKVAVIGCGPSGMFFLHATALRRKRLEKEGNAEALAALPEVTCFEKSPSPGGLWKVDHGHKKKSDNGEEQSANMYEALWTNGPKELIEFFDYTFDEHFGCALPTFMPRQLILEYMLARCTKDNPTIFDDVKFNTSVKAVNFHEDLGKFVLQIQTMNQETELSSTSVTESMCMFDKCIWAAGDNGRPKIPQNISQVLLSGGFKGRVMHSSETGSDFDQCVRGKKILIIGDAYSAEDLTLTAIKLGVETVDICSRSGEGVASYTSSWPMDKVNVHYAFLPNGVTNDGCGVVLKLDDGTETETGTNEMILDDIATIVYCTGYLKNMDMLHPSLRPASEGPYFEQYDIPQDWKMPTNDLFKEFGDIPIGEIIEPPFVRHDIYRGRLMSNPNMMFFEERIDTPLAELDVTAWLLLAQITGDLPLPSQMEMKQFNLDSLLEAMKGPYCRGWSDGNYEECWFSVDQSFDYEDTQDQRMKEIDKINIDFQFRMLARDMVDAKYPAQLGTFNKLNKKGKAFVAFNQESDIARCSMDKESPDASWRTFRDLIDPSKFYSLMTGTKAVPLKCRWLDIDGESLHDIVEKMEEKAHRMDSFE